MKTITKYITAILFSLSCIISCSGGSSGGGGGDTGITFNNASTPGQAVAVTAGTTTFYMIYSNNRTGITFPTAIDDSGTATLTRKFFTAETEVTNELFCTVLQWALDNGKIVETGGAHNEVNASTVKYGGQELVDLDYAQMKISYNETTDTFTVDSGYENHPVVTVSWYGSVMFCNWLTEMMDGNTNNVVYTGINTSWDHLDTVDNADRTGYRLPSSDEWEYAARYVGTSVPTIDNLAFEYISQNYNGGDAALTPGYYWTPGDYASGAIKDNSQTAETGDVAWYQLNCTEVKVAGTAGYGGTTLRTGNSNALGIYDMSGNVWEWCFNANGFNNRITRGGGWISNAGELITSHEYPYEPDQQVADFGFRVVKTQ